MGTALRPDSGPSSNSGVPVLSPPVPSASRDFEQEQQHLDLLYRHLEDRRVALERELAESLAGNGGTRVIRVERDAAAWHLRRCISALDAAEHALCFGRLDLVDGGRRYIGRVGLRGAESEDAPLLVDWRAPAARSFYTATPAAPHGIRRRRHLHTRGRRLRRLDDEILEWSGAASDDVHLSGDAALLASLSAPRTGRMRDVVETLQAEQDRIIRAPLQGVLVVQGAPGTGKTVVALHRAAYLLYTHSELQRRGVLVLAPTPLFLDYISEVIPGLGETNVLLASETDLFPGVRATRDEPAAVARLKGRLELADVVTRAVRDREGAVHEPFEVTVCGERLTIKPQIVADAVAEARATGSPHNVARAVFGRVMLDHLARLMAWAVTDLEADLEAQLERSLAPELDPAELDLEVEEDIRSVFGPEAPVRDPDAAARTERAERQAVWREALPADADVQALLDGLWPDMTPQRLLEDLFADTQRLDTAAVGLLPQERALLRRDPGEGWSVADVPLLDEAAELLGVGRREQDAVAAAERAAELEYARGVIRLLAESRDAADEGVGDSEVVSDADMLTARELADMQAETDTRTLAQRAAADRTWAFGHVIVDEAQELSPMMWRLLVRRCPTRSFTVVGDTAQTVSPAGGLTWERSLGQVFGDRWRLEQLSVNYRIPAEVMAASLPLLNAIDPLLRPARAVREGGDIPVREEVAEADLIARAAEIAAQELRATAEAKVAVITARSRWRALVGALPRDLPSTQLRDGDVLDLESPVVVLTARQAKGLEFDTVVVVDPQAVLEDSVRGANDLYVAMTRASSRLVVLHCPPVPDVLAALRRRPGPT